MKKGKYQYLFFKSYNILLYTGIAMIGLFFLIFIISAAVTGHLNYFSYFFHSIKKMLPLMIAGGFHVALLALGLVSIFLALSIVKKQVYCYEDRFVISQLMQKRVVIPFEDIKGITIRFSYVHNSGENLENYREKECRIYFNNPIYNFYLPYLVSGYYDELDIINQNGETIMPFSGYVKKSEIEGVFGLIKGCNKGLPLPHLPAEYSRNRGKVVI